jgi:tRNA(Ile2) C34 agmatinyltransferase TiaS
VITKITIPALLCKCEKCGHEWESVGDEPPTNCRKCRSREWNGKKRLSHTREIRFPAPRKGGRPRVVNVIGEEI